jgi:uncharacterized membrane protein
MSSSNITAEPLRLTEAKITAIAHLYRAEVYRSAVWRVRFDNTTNWAVVTTGIAISVSFSSSAASPLPLVLVGLLVAFFLLVEARRFRHFEVWRTRARLLERRFYAPLLRGQKELLDPASSQYLAEDYETPHHRMSYVRAIGRRLRYNYGWIFLIQALAYYGKLSIHPQPLTTLSELWERAAIGPFPGQAVVCAGILFHGSWAAFAVFTMQLERRRRRRPDRTVPSRKTP